MKQECVDDSACFERLFGRDDVDMVGIPAEVLGQSQPDRRLQRRESVVFSDEEALRQAHECALRGQTVREDEAEVRFLEVIAFRAPRAVVGALVAVGRAVELPAVVADDESRVDDRLSAGEDLLPLTSGSEVRRCHCHGVEVADSEAETVDEPSGAYRRWVDVGGGSDDVGALPALIIGVADACLVAVDHGTDFAQLYGFETLTDIGDGRIAAPRALGRRSGAGASVVGIAACRAEPQFVGLTLVGAEFDRVDSCGQRPSVERGPGRKIAQCLFGAAFKLDAFVLIGLRLLVPPTQGNVQLRGVVEERVVRQQLVGFESFDPVAATFVLQPTFRCPLRRHRLAVGIFVLLRGGGLMGGSRLEFVERKVDLGQLVLQ